jgi:hypothetical protein
MRNPTIVVLTDRNDLDDQLFGTFARCRDLLRQPPMQVENRADLREKLRVGAGGVVFTTIQKFLPEERGGRYPVLSDRRNIIVIADEAHRSQYDFIDGFARHMRDALPNASFIGFTGTPMPKIDRLQANSSLNLALCRLPFVDRVGVSFSRGIVLANLYLATCPAVRVHHGCDVVLCFAIKPYCPPERFKKGR